MSNPTILVTGATGAQGGGVARALLKSGRYTVRALTRNPNSDKAAALKKAGAQLVVGDLADAASLRPALKGVEGCFGVTSFWEHFGKELEHGQNLVNAVAEANLRHFVFSTLPHVKKATGLDVPHFDIKARLQDLAVSKKIPSTFVHVAFYYENFLYFFPPKKQPDGTFAFGFPQGDTPLAAVGVEDVGPIVGAIFGNPGAHLGTTRGIVGDDLPAAEYAKLMTRALGKTIRYNYIPRDVFAGFGFPGADDLANMFEYYRLHVPSRKADVDFCRQINPQMQTFETWLKANKAAFVPILA